MLSKIGFKVLEFTVSAATIFILSCLSYDLCLLLLISIKRFWLPVDAEAKHSFLKVGLLNDWKEKVEHEEKG